MAMSPTFNLSVSNITTEANGFIECILDRETRALIRVVSDNSDSNYWYTFAMKYTSDHILRMFCRHRYLEHSQKQVYLISDSYECTLEKWVTSNDIVDANGRFTEAFIQILRDVIKGLIFLYENKESHGNICASAIVIVGKHAKLVNVIGQKNAQSDFSSLALMIGGFFKAKGLQLKSEMQLFINYTASITDLLHARQLINHPIFLTPCERFSYRLLSYSLCGVRLRWIERGLNSILTARNLACSWTVLVQNYAFLHSVYLKGTYPSSAAGTHHRFVSGFLRFNKNVCQHAVDYGHKEGIGDVERQLDDLWPEFIAILHEVLIAERIFVMDPA